MIKSALLHWLCINSRCGHDDAAIRSSKFDYPISHARTAWWKVKPNNVTNYALTPVADTMPLSARPNSTHKCRNYRISRARTAWWKVKSVTDHALSRCGHGMVARSSKFDLQVSFRSKNFHHSNSQKGGSRDPLKIRISKNRQEGVQTRMSGSYIPNFSQIDTKQKIFK